MSTNLVCPSYTKTKKIKMIQTLLLWINFLMKHGTQDTFKIIIFFVIAFLSLYLCLFSKHTFFLSSVQRNCYLQNHRSNTNSRMFDPKQRQLPHYNFLSHQYVRHATTASYNISVYTVTQKKGTRVYTI